MLDCKRTRYSYKGRGLLELVGPRVRGAAASGRFRISELVWWGEV